jgi:hypothetical protein
MEVTGLVAVLAFSLGLAAVLATIGLVLVQGRSYLSAKTAGKPSSPLSRFLEAQLPVLGALVITIVGVMLVAFSLIRLGVIDPAKFAI